jgi:outer membrane protein TolC
VKNNYYEMLGTLSLNQKLWKNSLGEATRAWQEAAKLQSKSLGFQSKELEEDWFLKVMELYYQTWLAQARVKASQANLIRSESLVKAVEARSARGALSKPDLLQAKSVHEIAQVHLD